MPTGERSCVLTLINRHIKDIAGTMVVVAFETYMLFICFEQVKFVEHLVMYFLSPSFLKPVMLNNCEA